VFVAFFVELGAAIIVYIDNRAGLEQQPLLLQQCPHGVEDPGGELMRFQQVSDAQNRRFVGHRILAEFNAGKPAHRLAVVQHVFGLRVREIEPLLEEVHAQQGLHRQWAPAATRLRVVRRDEGDDPCPGDRTVHLTEKRLAARHFALRVVGHTGETLLCMHRSILGMKCPADRLTSPHAKIARGVRLVQSFPRGTRRGCALIT